MDKESRFLELIAERTERMLPRPKTHKLGRPHHKDCVCQRCERHRESQFAKIFESYKRKDSSLHNLETPEKPINSK